jgi:hypothetical protein
MFFIGNMRDTVKLCVPDVVHTSAELPHLHCHIQYIHHPHSKKKEMGGREKEKKKK